MSVTTFYPLVNVPKFKIPEDVTPEMKEWIGLVQSSLSGLSTSLNDIAMNQGGSILNSIITVEMENEAPIAIHVPLNAAMNELGQWYQVIEAYPSWKITLSCKTTDAVTIYRAAAGAAAPLTWTLYLAASETDSAITTTLEQIRLSLNDLNELILNNASGILQLLTGGLPAGLSAGAVSATSVTTTNLIVDGETITYPLPIAEGGTGQIAAEAAFNALAPTAYKGDLIVSNSATNVSLPVGTDGQVLSANSSAATGLRWVNEYAPCITTKGDLLTHNGSGEVRLPVGTDGQLLMAASGATEGMKWGMPPSPVAGSNTEVQFNSSGVFGASSNLTWDGGTLGVTGRVSASTILVPEVVDVHDNTVLGFSHVDAAVNYLDLSNAATGNGITLQPDGADTDVALYVKPKAAGGLYLGAANIKFPSADGSAGHFLKTDGAGVLSFGYPWATVTGFICTSPTGAMAQRAYYAAFYHDQSHYINRIRYSIAVLDGTPTIQVGLYTIGTPDVLVASAYSYPTDTGVQTANLVSPYLMATDMYYFAVLVVTPGNNTTFNLAVGGGNNTFLGYYEDGLGSLPTNTTKLGPVANMFAWGCVAYE